MWARKQRYNGRQRVWKNRKIDGVVQNNDAARKYNSQIKRRKMRRKDDKWVGRLSHYPSMTKHTGIHLDLHQAAGGVNITTATDSSVQRRPSETQDCTWSHLLPDVSSQTKWFLFVPASYYTRNSKDCALMCWVSNSLADDAAVYLKKNKSTTLLIKVSCPQGWCLRVVHILFHKNVTSAARE